MSMSELENAAPRVHSVLTSRAADPDDLDESVQDPFDDREVFDLVRSDICTLHTETLLACTRSIF